MAKLRYDSVNGKAEFEGSPEEILAIFDGLKQREIAGERIKTIVVNGKRYRATHPHDTEGHTLLQPETIEQRELEAKMPTIKELFEYILSKPKYEHDIIDVSKKFFGKQIKAREHGKLYRKLKARLELTRKGMEASQRGAFERRRSPYRNLQIYTFKKVNATPLSTTL
jgi:hypothetical protein